MTLAPTMVATRETLSRLLRTRGLRITPQREKILDIFYALPEGEHLSAEELQNRLRTQDSDISLATSYRTLKLLASLGVLREHAFSADQRQYELLREDEGLEHQHIICTGCGKTVEFTCEPLYDLAQSVAEHTGFTLTEAQLKLYGCCRACSLK